VQQPDNHLASDLVAAMREGDGAAYEARVVKKLCELLDVPSSFILATAKERLGIDKLTLAAFDLAQPCPIELKTCRISSLDCLAADDLFKKFPVTPPVAELLRVLRTRPFDSGLGLVFRWAGVNDFMVVHTLSMELSTFAKRRRRGAAVYPVRACSLVDLDPDEPPIYVAIEPLEALVEIAWDKG
jgi:hypothetical protein